MATLTRWDPFRDLVSIQSELNRLFGRTDTGADNAADSGSWLSAPKKITARAKA